MEDKLFNVAGKIVIVTGSAHRHGTAATLTD